jgi:antitoxin (DNA-binding transcriptional repressor) of toxin-antitoxin stability system
MLDQSSELTINATAFKARCLGLMDDLSRGRLKRVFITKHGKVVAEMAPPPPKVAKVSIIGCMKDEYPVSHDVDWDKVARERAALSAHRLTDEELVIKFQQGLYPST